MNAQPTAGSASGTASEGELPASGAAGPTTLLDRADLLLCLSRAFLPPPPQWSVCDWAQPLADDLAELGQSLAIDTGPIQAALSADCKRWADEAAASGSADTWLVAYSRLFLTPPVKVPLNTGLYLEGSLAGQAAQMMSACYEVAGVLPDERFRDLPDHVAMQLELLGRLYERAARGEADAADMAEEFAAVFVTAWTGPLQRACVAADAPGAEVFRALAALIPAAATGDKGDAGARGAAGSGR